MFIMNIQFIITLALVNSHAPTRAARAWAGLTKATLRRSAQIETIRSLDTYP